MDKQKTIFYENELTDDFATSVKSLKPLPSKYAVAKLVAPAEPAQYANCVIL